VRPYFFDFVSAGSPYRPILLAIEIIVVTVSVVVTLFFSVGGMKSWFGDWAFGLWFFFSSMVVNIVSRAYWEGIQELRRPGAERQPTRED
jgi:hypothetical protein